MTTNIREDERREAAGRRDTVRKRAKNPKARFAEPDHPSPSAGSNPPDTGSGGG
ncbi:MAG: hypothetical protein GY953_43425 [bacterium]|nr:hypothetical protein [bacterium]